MALKLSSPGMVIYLLLSIVPDAFIGTPFEPSMQASLYLCDGVSSTGGGNSAPLLVWREETATSDCREFFVTEFLQGLLVGFDDAQQLLTHLCGGKGLLDLLF